MLLLSITLPVLEMPAWPTPVTALVGKLVPAGLMLQNETVLLLFAIPVVVLLKRMLPLARGTAAFDDPSTVHLVIVLFCAPLMKRMVLVPLVVETVVLESVRELPSVFNPSIMTLLAPLRLINGLPAGIAPEIVRAPPSEGSIRMEV